MLKDIQQERDVRNIALDRVGVKNVKHPVLVMDFKDGMQATIANVSMSVFLPHEYRGTHMSRFIEILEAHTERISPSSLKKITESLCDKLDAPEASVKFEFPYFIRKKAPVSGLESYMSYNASFEGTFLKNNAIFDAITGISVPVQTLCPCSKEISDNGAHNQRAVISIKIKSNGLVWFEELIEMAESSASTPLYTLLKRPDEKYVTEHAYNNPRFVEDAARELAIKLDNDERIFWYSISVTSSESIHNHDAFAEITREKKINKLLC